jgi:TolB-like protein
MRPIPILIIALLFSGVLHAEENGAPPASEESEESEENDAPAAEAQAPNPEEAADPKKAEKPKILLMDLRPVEVSPDTVKLIDGILATQVSKIAVFDAVSSDDVRQMAKLEADKASAGCNDDESCLAEIAGALGARYVLYGQVGALGETMIVNLNLKDTRKTGGVVRETIQAGKIDEIPGKLKPVLDKMVDAIGVEWTPSESSAGASVSVSKKGKQVVVEASADSGDYWGGFSTGITQTGVNTCCFGGAWLLTFIIPDATVSCIGFPIVCCANPFCMGYATAALGDGLSAKRGTVIWPTVTALTIQTLGVGATLVANLIVFGINADPSPELLADLQGTAFLLSASGIIATSVLAAVGATTTYFLTADDKRPGDKGSFSPGWFSPNHPGDEEGADEGEKQAESGKSPNSRVMLTAISPAAMAY